MKKIMMMAVMALMASTAFAQDVVKQILGAGSADEALTLIKPALPGLSNEDKAKVYNAVVDLAMKKVTSIEQKIAADKIAKKETPFDTVGYHNALLQALKYGFECEKYDALPNAKGKVKPKFRKTNCDRLQSVRTQLINVGLDAYNSRDLKKAFEIFSLYSDSKGNPLFEGVDFTKDQYYGQVTYYAALAAYQNKDYDLAVKYADVAMADPEMAKEAEEIKIFCLKENTKTAADSVKYLNTIKEMHAQNPQNERYFGLLMEYYGQPGRTAQLQQFIKDEMARDPNNKMIWALKGETEMNDRKWDDAIASYKKSLEFDPEFVQVLFNIGICLNSKALEFKDQMADKMGRLSQDNMSKFMGMLEESKTYMEHFKKIDPEHKSVNWPYPLYQVYYILYGENDSRTQEMKGIAGM